MERIPDFVLGTKFFGSPLFEDDCISVLNFFYQSGYRTIELSSAYPENNDLNFFRFAENVVETWILKERITDLNIFQKIGPIDNISDHRINLSPSFLLMNADYYASKFQCNLKAFFIYSDLSLTSMEISQSIKALSQIHEKLGIEIGLSCIENPEMYFEEAEKFQLSLILEGNQSIDSSYIPENVPSGYHQEQIVKVSSLKQDVYEKYINSLSMNDRSEHFSFLQLNMIHSYFNPKCTGILFAPHSIQELRDTILFYKQLADEKYSVVYNKLKRLPDPLSSLPE